MVPIRFAFRNRWWTLLWAAGMCLTAFQVAGRHGDDGASADAPARDRQVAAAPAAQPDQDDLGAAVAALNQAQ